MSTAPVIKQIAKRKNDNSWRAWVYNSSKAIASFPIDENLAEMFIASFSPKLEEDRYFVTYTFTTF